MKNANLINYKNLNLIHDFLVSKQIPAVQSAIKQFNMLQNYDHDFIENEHLKMLKAHLDCILQLSLDLEKHISML